jgi:hypothetical protein
LGLFFNPEISGETRRNSATTKNAAPFRYAANREDSKKNPLLPREKRKPSSSFKKYYFGRTPSSFASL